MQVCITGMWATQKESAIWPQMELGCSRHAWLCSARTQAHVVAHGAVDTCNIGRRHLALSLVPEALVIGAPRRRCRRRRSCGYSPSHSDAHSYVGVVVVPSIRTARSSSCSFLPSTLRYCCFSLLSPGLSLSLASILLCMHSVTHY